MDAAKEEFLKHKFIPLLRSLSPETKPSWGKMSAIQMVEHFSDAVRIASSKLVFENFVSPADTHEKMQLYIMSDKPFRENTPNPLLPETPLPAKHAKYSDAVDELEEEINYFFEHFQSAKMSRNPIFGDLDYEKNVHLLYKHALHHLKQFGINP